MWGGVGAGMKRVRGGAGVFNGWRKKYDKSKIILHHRSQNSISKDNVSLLKWQGREHGIFGSLQFKSTMKVIRM